jgi:hypothetical protein
VWEFQHGEAAATVGRTLSTTFCCSGLGGSGLNLASVWRPQVLAGHGPRCAGWVNCTPAGRELERHLDIGLCKTAVALELLQLGPVGLHFLRGELWWRLRRPAQSAPHNTGSIILFHDTSKPTTHIADTICPPPAPAKHPTRARRVRRVLALHDDGSPLALVLVLVLARPQTHRHQATLPQQAHAHV